MNLIKVDVGIWVDVNSGELPNLGTECICKEDIHNSYKTDEVPFGGDITHWLKPIKQVYVLTENEIKGMLTKFLDANVRAHLDGGKYVPTEYFLNSITNRRNNENSY